MSDAASISRSTYLTKNIGDYEDEITINGISYSKVNDLRYGTNPHQTAALYKPHGMDTPIGDLKVLKDGKSGLSQTNLEDISYALNICKFFDKNACAVMKHVNPSGAGVSAPGDSILDVYVKARDCDPRAAFGSTIVLNCNIDETVAAEMMSSFIECVVAPEITDDALAVFNDFKRFKLNKHVRVLQCGDLSILPRFVGDENAGIASSIKVLADGSLIVAAPLLTNLHCTNDLKIAEGENKKCGHQKSNVSVSDQQLDDLLTAWYINMNVRSNGVVIVKNGGTLAVGTGEQDRVGAVEQAIIKCKDKYEGSESVDGSVMSSDGFFPFSDAVEIAAAAGVSAFIAPAGSIQDAAVIKRANELNVCLFHAPERIFSHH